MRKIKFYYFIAVVGAMALSLSSCTKDLEDDVDQLKKDMAENKSAISALEQAIKAGKLITDVKTVADGFEITFSDGSKIAVKNGTNGTNGTNGANGSTGPAGSNGVDGSTGPAGSNGVDGFAPIIGIDSENYWTVIKTQDGTAERILVDGKGVKAIGTANVQVIDGVLWIDGVATTLGNLPSVVINEAQGTALISMWDGTAMKSFTVLMHNSNTIIRSISTPYTTASGAIDVNIVNGKAAKTFTGGPFAGKIQKDQVFKSSGALPIIVNPFNAVITKDMVTLVNRKEVALDVNIIDVERGFDGAFTRTATPSNGLWSIKLGATSATPASTDFIAVKVKLNNSESIYSTYDYRIVTTNATPVTLSAFTGSRAIGKDIIFAATETIVNHGKTENLFNVNPADIMFSNIALHEDSKSFEKYIEFIKDANGNITGVKAKDNGESHIALNNKTVKFIYTVVDYNGNSQNYPNGVYSINSATIANVTFLTLYDFDMFALADINHTISGTVATTDILADLDPLFNQLGDARHSVWRDYSTALTVVIKDKNNTVVNGIVATTVKVDKTAAADGKDFPRYIKFVVTNGTVLPGEYTATMTYTDSRNGGDVKKFTTTIKIIIKNPADIETTLKVERIAAYFDGNNVITYGTALSTGNKVAQSVLADTQLDLTKLYNNVNTNRYIFEIAPAHALETSSIFKIAANDMYKTYKVTVYGIFAGNATNKIKVDEFTLMPKSEVKEGSIALIAGKTLSVSAGDNTTKVKISSAYVAKDVYANDLTAFGISKDVRVANVAIVVDQTDSNRGLITAPEYDANDGWVITASSELNVMSDTDVKLNVTITDLFGQKLEKTITVTVKKRI